MNKIIILLLTGVLLLGKAVAQPPTTHTIGTVPVGVQSTYTFGRPSNICIGFTLTEAMNANITLNCEAGTVMLFKISPYSASSGIGVTDWTLDPGIYRYYVTNPQGNVPAIVCSLTFNPISDINDLTSIYPAGKNYIKKSVPSIAKSTINHNPSEEQITVEYFDGLGRPVESVMQGFNPNKADLVTINGYDDVGRIKNTWLPVVLTNNNGNYADITNVRAAVGTTYPGENAPLSKNLYDSSPLSRVMLQYGPGVDWLSNGKAVSTGYLANVAKSGTTLTYADSLVCGNYIASDDKKSVAIYRTGNYPANKLSVTRMRDEDGNISYEFKNSLGFVVLTRQINMGKFHDTNYIYDCHGNLRAVFPPEASDRLLFASTAPPWTEQTSEDLKLWAYLYKYDNRNRCIAKKLPGCDWVYYVYDKADQLIFTQDGERRTKGEWTFHIPDAFGRTVLTGTCTNTMDYAADPLKNVAVRATWSKTTNTYKGYSVTGMTLNMPTVLSANYYDSYEFMGLNSIPDNTDANFKYNAESGYGAWHGTDYSDANKYKNKGLLTGALSAQIKADGTVATNYLYSVMYYDNRGRLIQTKSNNVLPGGTEKEYLSYTFSGQPLWRKHVHAATGKNTQSEVYGYNYDHAGRLIKTTHQLTDGTTVKPQVVLLENSYDELGRLASSIKNGKANLTTAYTYNIRSWTKSIANSLFSQTLYYNESYGGSSKRYNGNISAMQWKHADESKQRGYTFTYDSLSRLIRAGYLENATVSNNYSTNYSYDMQGNILTKQRYGLISTGTYGLTDSLSLSYTGNQLIKVENAVTESATLQAAGFKNYSSTATEYTYNTNGSMVKDLNKGISAVTYNLLNLPQYVDIKSPKGEARHEYTYSAGGQKLKVVQKWNPNHSATPVIGSAINVSTLTMSRTTDYVGNMIYENGNLQRILLDGGYYEGGVYYFYLNDHLGNNRVVANANGTVVQKIHYYPFGATFAESTNRDKQPYQYNGKELESMHGLELYDYGARFYDAEIGRWNVVDPLAEKYLNLSPYSYVASDPINLKDPDGKRIVLTTYDNEQQKYVSLEYRNGDFYNGKNRLDISKIGDRYGVGIHLVHSTFKMIENSGSEYLNNQLSTLIDSDNIHNIRDYYGRAESERFAVSDDGMFGDEYKKGESLGSIFEMDFSPKSWNPGRKDYVETPQTIITHELRHMYDYEIGNMRDNSKKSNVNNPAEMRAVHSENVFRRIYGIPERSTYDGKIFLRKNIDNPQNNKSFKK